MSRRPPRSILFPTRRSSDLGCRQGLRVRDHLFLILDEVRLHRMEEADGLRSEEHTLNSSHMSISYAVFCLQKKKTRKKIFQPQEEKTVALNTRYNIRTSNAQ